jgi:GNAT superfamily N-acetyltransferase
MPLARLLEHAEAAASGRCLEVWMAARPEAGGATAELAGGRALFFTPGSPLSQALSLGMNGSVSGEEFSRLEDFFTGRGAPVAISLCPYADPTLLAHLGRRGYRVTHFEHTLWRRCAGESNGRASGDVTIRAVQDGEAMLWTQTVMTGFADGGDASPEMLDLFATFLGGGSAETFLAEVDGQVAGGAAMAFTGDVAVLHGDSTLPAFRCRGAQTALIAERILRARRAGCRYAMACTLPGSASQRNYERMGFTVAYTKAMMTSF